MTTDDAATADGSPVVIIAGQQLLERGRLIRQAKLRIEGRLVRERGHEHGTELGTQPLPDKRLARC